MSKPDDLFIPKCEVAGKSIIAFGIVSFLSSIVFAIVADAFAIDLGSFILMYLGAEVIRGMRKAAKWALGLMVYYSTFFIFSGFMLATGNAGSLKIMGNSIHSFNAGVAAFILFIYAAWAITNAVLSKQALAETASYINPELQPFCKRCGYSLKMQPFDRCPECGQCPTRIPTDLNKTDLHKEPNGQS